MEDDKKTLLEKFKNSILDDFNKESGWVKFFRRFSVIRFLLAMLGFLLFLQMIPTLLILGYADACYDQGLDYIGGYHICYDLDLIDGMISKQIFFETHKPIGRWGVMLDTLNFEEARRRNEETDIENLMRQWEIPTNKYDGDWTKGIGVGDGLEGSEQDRAATTETFS